MLLHQVLIESDWNLKSDNDAVMYLTALVLIESDWNLKHDTWLLAVEAMLRINRIRLEFKDHYADRPKGRDKGINRIRLEFKDI